ncbi:L-lactate dehydrogenase [Qiania dongpingensis]|uniref:L-lactate dehydrogenase n=1 Tax=Qiania dongpingensis TaxID=2763669 RepID=A0A7G9G2I6_9FIRM|nr:L-lactate dehydrogenase [Qiania dongpingensis]QNM05018.1 L-lactate dehydrogenase [Qiania dongpingensis]
MTILQRSKIVVIGAGNVGEAIGYTLMLRRQASEIVLVDLNEDRAMGSALDIAHGTAFFRQAKIRKGGYDECADAEIIIITAGIARKPGQTRLDLAKTNVSIIKSITKNIMEYAENPMIIVVSNPVDIMTYVVQKESGLPSERVIGTGTALDTARFRYFISDKCNVDVCDVNAFILGEHGDSQVAIWSRATIGGNSVESFMAESGQKLDMEEIFERARDSGAEVISLKGATFYGIAMTVSRIVEAITDDENAVLPVAHVLGEDFEDWSDVAISMPCVLNREGIAKTIRIPMSIREQEAMDASTKKLKDFLREVLEQ